MPRLSLAAVLLVITLVVAAVIDIAIWPSFSTAIFYVIPLAIAARSFSPRIVVITGVFAVALEVLGLHLGGVPLQYWPYSVLALATIAVMAAQSSRLRLSERQRVREAEAAREQLREFMGLVVHDLRSPLTVAMGYTQIARRQLLGHTINAIYAPLDKTERSLHSMLRLVNDLLDSTRIGGGRFVIHPAPVDLADLVRHVVEELRSINAGNAFCVDVPDHLVGEWDADRLRQVLANLISNAVKFSPTNTNVTVTLRAENASVRLSVTDEGVGISPDQIDQLFQPFSRLGNDRKVAGTGLGLYISKGIVEAHGGRIWVESTVSEGSTFSVELPHRHPASPARDRSPTQ